MDTMDVEPIRAAMASAEDPLRLLGLYVETSDVVGVAADGSPVGVFHGLIGDAAFSTRVQDPGAAATDQVFRQLAHEEGKGEFDRTRADLERRLAEGKPLFGDDE